MSNNFTKENIVILSLFGMFFGIIVLFYADYVHEDVYAMIYASPIIVCVVISLSLSYHYKKSRNFSLGFLFFGMSMLLLLIAEVMWVVMPYFEIPQYESYPDIFYLGYATLSLIFPWFVLKHYQIRLNIIHYLVILLITIVGILAYVELSNGDLHSSSFNLGLVFAVLTSFLTGISIIMLFVLRNTKIFRVWMLIAFSLFISAIADIWYYASENTEDWSASDFTNIVWFVSYLIMIYALGEQRHSYVITEKKSFKQVKEKKGMEKIQSKEDGTRHFKVKSEDSNQSK